MDVLTPQIKSGGDPGIRNKQTHPPQLYPNQLDVMGEFEMFADGRRFGGRTPGSTQDPRVEDTYIVLRRNQRPEYNETNPARARPDGGLGTKSAIHNTMGTSTENKWYEESTGGGGIENGITSGNLCSINDGKGVGSAPTENRSPGNQRYAAKGKREKAQGNKNRLLNADIFYL